MGEGWKNFKGSFETLWEGTKAIGSKVSDATVGGGNNAKGIFNFAGRTIDKGLGFAGDAISATGNFAKKNSGLATIMVAVALFNPIKNFVKKHILGQQLEQASGEADLQELRMPNNERAAAIAAVGAGNNPNGVNWVQQTGKGNTAGRYM